MLGDIATNININTGYTDMRKSINRIYATILDPDLVYSVAEDVTESRFCSVSLMGWSFSINGMTLYKANTDEQKIAMREKILPGNIRLAYDGACNRSAKGFKNRMIPLILLAFSLFLGYTFYSKLSSKSWRTVIKISGLLSLKI